MQKYKPPLLCRSSVLSLIFNNNLKGQVCEEINFERVTIDQEGAGSPGHFYLDVAYPKQSKGKVMLIFPGVVGDSADFYVQDLVCEANERGYTACVVNHTLPKKESGCNMKLFDICSSKDDHFVEQLVNQIKCKFGDVPIFVAGFSLGGNYFLRGLGECQDGKVDGIRAFATIC